MLPCIHADPYDPAFRDQAKSEILLAFSQATDLEFGVSPAYHGVTLQWFGHELIRLPEPEWRLIGHMPDPLADELILTHVDSPIPASFVRVTDIGILGTILRLCRDEHAHSHPF